MTEVFFDFNPNYSVFNTLDSGFVLEPDIKVISSISMTAEQDLRVVNSLRQNANIVCKEAELIFQASVSGKNSFSGVDDAGKNRIYTSVNLRVEDRLRGILQNPDEFKLRTLGGSVNGLNLRISSMPEFRNGERSILFLKKYGNEYGLVRGEFGKVNL